MTQEVKDGVHLENCDIAILGIEEETSWGYRLLIKPEWSQYAMKSTIRKNAVLDGQIEEIREQCPDAFKAKLAMDNGKLDEVPVLNKSAVLIRGNAKNTATETITDDQGNSYERVMADKKDLKWSYFWDVHEILGNVEPTTSVNLPNPQTQTTLGATVKAQGDIRDYGMNRRTALMQAVAMCDGLNRGRQIETQIDERDILVVADQYFDWLQQPTTPDEPVKSQPITQESNNAPITESQKSAMTEYAESLGASVVGEVPEGLETMGDLSTYLIEDRKITMDSIKMILGNLGFSDSADYFKKNGGVTPHNVRTLGIKIIKENTAISGDLPW